MHPTHVFTAVSLHMGVLPLKSSEFLVNVIMGVSKPFQTHWSQEPQLTHAQCALFVLQTLFACADIPSGAVVTAISFLTGVCVGVSEEGGGVFVCCCHDIYLLDVVWQFDVWIALMCGLHFEEVSLSQVQTGSVAACPTHFCYNTVCGMTACSFKPMHYAAYSTTYQMLMPICAGCWHMLLLKAVWMIAHKVAQHQVMFCLHYALNRCIHILHPLYVLSA